MDSTDTLPPTGCQVFFSLPSIFSVPAPEWPFLSLKDADWTAGKVAGLRKRSESPAKRVSKASFVHWHVLQPAATIRAGSTDEDTSEWVAREPNRAPSPAASFLSTFAPHPLSSCQRRSAGGGAREGSPYPVPAGPSTMRSPIFAFLPNTRAGRRLRRCCG